MVEQARAGVDMYQLMGCHLQEVSSNGREEGRDRKASLFDSGPLQHVLPGWKTVQRGVLL